MFQDGIAPLSQAIRPRQTISAGSSSTTTQPSSTTSTDDSSTATISTFLSVTPESQAAFSTVSPGDSLDLGSKVCTAALPAGGVIRFNETYTLFLDESASYVARCGNQTVFDPCEADSSSTILNTPDPFYSSMSPQVYALATATVVSYVLLILIFITPRTFYVNAPGGRSGSAGHATGFRTLLPRAGGRGNGAIGIGRRPLLQKIAALTVVASLTIATADTFRVAQSQYTSGLVNSKELISRVVNSEEIRVTRVISDTFLWLAQVQTLIRLFPRHKEKVTIKWLGFGLVLFDTVFSILENFVNPSDASKPGTFTDAIPTLSYLFELAIGLIYASCVFYYALSKRRFAFWHARMRNVCLVALISIIAVLIPVVFFITDLAQPDIATWGEYIRWVGAAAASIVVWEWVERIEALERDEKKDGILGREIFDGDEMFEMTPTEDGYDNSSSGQTQNRDAKRSAKFWKNVRELHFDFQPKVPLKRMLKGRKLAITEQIEQVTDDTPAKTNRQSISRPPNAVTPISRSDTNSAASTVYAVRYHDIFSPSPAIPEEMDVSERTPPSAVNVLPAISDESTLTNSTDTTANPENDKHSDAKQAMTTGRQIWQGVGNPFKRKRTEPPAEVAAQIVASNSRRLPAGGPSNLRNRIDAFTTSQRAKLGARAQKNKSPLAVTFIPAQPRLSRANVGTEAPDSDDEAEVTTPVQPNENQPETDSDFGAPDLSELPVTIIPAPVRGGRTWSPDDLNNEEVIPPPRSDRPPSFSSGGQITNVTAGMRGTTPPVHSQRGTLTISESPGRIRDRHTPSNGTPIGSQRSRDNRSATIASISDRLGSASPGQMVPSPVSRSPPGNANGSGRSATADSTRQRP